MIAQGFCHLVKIELPGGDVLLSEGAEVIWGSDLFRPADAIYGGIGSVEALGEGLGDEVPALQMEMKVPGATAAADLLAPGLQNSLFTAWLAEWDGDSASVVGTPAVLFRGFVDQGRLARTATSLGLKLSIVSLLEQLFERNIGNGLNASFHKSVWPGETGEDHATGLSLPDAWGVESPAPASGTGGPGPGGSWWSPQVSR